MLTTIPKAKLPSWPPNGNVKGHRVKDGDNWWSLAKQYNRTDPWEIIEFNFRTRVPEEVNYYMATLLGSKKSNDGKNYSFSSMDQPGIVYIPPVTWKPQDRQDGIAFVLGAASEMERMAVNADRLKRILKNHIEIVDDPKLPTPWEYDFSNTLYRRPLRYGDGMPWLIRELSHIDWGPHGDGYRFCDTLDTCAWICAATYWSNATRGKLPFPIEQARNGIGPKRAIYAKAVEYVREWGPGVVAFDDRFEAIKKLVRADPDYARRVATGWRMTA